MEASDSNLNIHVVQDEDLEEFGVQLIEAVGNCSAEGPPTIAFSHTANGDGGYNYAAIVTGWHDPKLKTTIKDHRTRD
jgi:leucyl aminopeptidase